MDNNQHFLKKIKCNRKYYSASYEVRVSFFESLFQALICGPELGNNTNVFVLFFFSNVYFFAVGLDHLIGAN